MTQTAAKPQSETDQPLVIEVPAIREPQDSFATDRLFVRMRLLWQQRPLLYRSALAGIVLGTLLAFLIPNRYESITRLMPPDNQSSTGMAIIAALTAKNGSGIGSFAGDLLGMKSSGALFIGILRSQTVQDRLIQEFDLKAVYGVSLEDKARLKLDENTSISEDRKSGIVTITVTDRDAKRATAMAQAYVAELNRLVSELSTSSARREREFLEERLKSVRIDLEDAEKEFSQFSSKNNAIDIKEQGKAMVVAVASLEGQLIAAKSQLEGLRQIYSDNNVRVRAAQARVSELQNQLDRLGGKNDSSASGDNTQSESFYPTIRKLPLLGVTFADLYRRTRVEEAVFEALTQQYELAKVQEAKEIPTVKVLDEARVPERRSYPPRLMIIALCMVIAAALAAAFVLGQAQWTETHDSHQGKILATEIFHTMNAHMPWATPNGSLLQAASHKVWMRLVTRNGSVRERDEVRK